MLVTVFAAFLVAVAVAAILGAHTYQSERAASADLRPAAAVLIQTGPLYGDPFHFGQAEARWRGPGGGEQSGLLTTLTAPGIAGAAAGARIPVWLDRSGQPAAPSRAARSPWPLAPWPRAPRRSRVPGWLCSSSMRSAGSRSTGGGWPRGSLRGP